MLSRGSRTAHARDEDELVGKALLFLAEVGRQRAEIEEVRLVRPLAVDDDAAGRDALFCKFFRVQRAVFHGEHARREPVQKLVLAVTHGVVGALQRDHAVDDAPAEKAPRKFGARLPHEGKGARSPLAILVRERALIEEHAARRDLQASERVRAVGAGIALDDDLRVLHPPAFARGRGCEALHRAPRKFHAVAF